MVIAEHLGAAVAGRAVGVDKCLRVNLEMGLRGRVDVFSGQGGGDCGGGVRGGSEQDAAAFGRVGGCGVSGNQFKDFTNHPNPRSS